MGAAFRFVHVVRGDEKSHAVAGKLEQQVPQLAPRHRVNACRWFVQEQHGRMVHERTGHSQALPPAAGEQPGAPAQVGFQVRQRDQLIVALLKPCAAQAVKAAIKLEVLVRRQLVIERELLRHVANETLDLLQLPGHIQAADPRQPAARLEQPAQKPYHRGLARTIRAEKAEDRALLDLEADVINGGEVAKPLGQPFTLDHRLACHGIIR